MATYEARLDTAMTANVARAEIDALRAERDALLAALRECVSAYDGRILDITKVAANARAAIAKATECGAR